MNNNYQEKEIDLKDMLFYALYRWKTWLLAALILAVLLGGYKGFSTWKKATDSEARAQQEQAYKTALDAYEREKAALERSIETASQSLEEQREYLNDSVLMNLDYRNVYTATVTLYISADDESLSGMSYQSLDAASAIAASYQFTLNGNTFLNAIAKQVGTEIQYLRELLTFSQPDGVNRILNITIQQGSAEKAAQLQALILEGLDDVQAQLAESSGKHTLKTEVSTPIATVDTDLGDRQAAEKERLEGYEASISDSETALSELVVPTSSVVTESDAVKAAVKWFFIGALLGAVLVGGAACVAFALSGKVYSASALETTCGGRVLGVLASEKHYDGLTRRLRKLEGRLSENTEAAGDLLAACVQQYCGEGKILLVSGDAEDALLTAQADFLRQKLPQMQVICAGGLLRDAAAVQQLNACDSVLLVEMCGQSHYARVDRELALVNDAGKPMIGFIVIEA